MCDKVKRITFEIDEETFYKLKAYCVINKKTFKELLTELVKEKIK